MTLKINRQGQVTDSADLAARLAEAKEEVAELEAEEAAEPSGPHFSPDQLLGARHDTPDVTGPVVDSEPAPELAPDAPLPPRPPVRRPPRTSGV